MKNHSLIDADGNTHVKIAAVAVGLGCVHGGGFAERPSPLGQHANSRPGREGDDDHHGRRQRAVSGPLGQARQSNPWDISSPGVQNTGAFFV